MLLPASSWGESETEGTGRPRAGHVPLPLTSSSQELRGNNLLDIMDDGTNPTHEPGAQSISEAHRDRLAREVVNLHDNLQAGHH